MGVRKAHFAIGTLACITLFASPARAKRSGQESQSQGQNKYADLVAQAQVDLKNGDAAKALEESQKAVELDPSRWQAYLIAGVSQQSQNLDNDALDSFMEALEKAPPDIKPRVNKTVQDFIASEYATPAGKFEAIKAQFNAGVIAIDEAQKLKAQMASSPAEQKGALKIDRDKAASTAVLKLQAALNISSVDDPNRSVLLGNLGRAYELGENYPEAIKAYQESAKVKPDGAVLDSLGTALFKNGQIGEGTAALRQAIDLETDPAKASLHWSNLGISLLNSKKIPESIDAFRSSVSTDHSNATSWYFLGLGLTNEMQLRATTGTAAVIIPDGTIEAFRQTIETDTTGRFAPFASQYLITLKQIGGGIAAMDISADGASRKTSPVATSANTAAGLLISKTTPFYPPLARAARVDGSVVISAIVGVDGIIHHAYVVSGHPLLAMAAMDAIREWRYRPLTVDGKPVEIDTKISVIFTLSP
jgi:TonB family protein